jgi:hypothetical protein
MMENINMKRLELGFKVLVVVVKRVDFNAVKRHFASQIMSQNRFGILSAQCG